MNWIAALRVLALAMVLPQIFLPELWGQKKEIYIREFYDDKSLELLLFDLEMNYPIDFMYDPGDISVIEIKIKNIKGLKLETAMKALLKDTDLDLRIEEGRTIHIYPNVEEEEVYVDSTKQNINVSGYIYD